VKPRGKVLLVDDEEKLVRNLGRALRDEGHEVTTATNAGDAQSLLANRPFDVLVVDHRMPERTGLELIRDVSSSVPDGDLPQILLMTAHATIENAIRSSPAASSASEPNSTGSPSTV
jgi:DNA-binding NtrC family response regulator